MMPLVMSMRPGQDFYVGDARVIMGDVRGRRGFDLIVEKTGSKHCITEKEATEIMPEVFVSSGNRPTAGIARVAVEAPQDVMILRGDRYRESTQ